LPVVLNENGPDGTIDYGYGLGLLESSSSTFNYFYDVDRLGSVSDLTDSTGRVQERYTYDAWGNALTATGNVGTKNKVRFTGQALDPGTGLYFLRARYYQPASGRLLIKDPFPGFTSVPLTENKYLYAFNNPETVVDPGGNLGVVDDTIFLLAGALEGITTQATEDLAKGRASSLGLYAFKAGVGAFSGWVAGNCGELTAGLGIIACRAVVNVAAEAFSGGVSNLFGEGESPNPCKYAMSAAFKAITGPFFTDGVVSSVVQGIFGGVQGFSSICSNESPK
jgi:RHS repeat-associated protein